ncbi:hypothetical protein TSUD_171920 [Trifolium subterraneum]|uniref:Prenyltransferase alpha-alpha toroid domain-containing protein n=1 Tax=Trifolium subterraneum TaxID=3900 RepID=A0A2Z6LJW1_TRISU|nr:hypothetical protein TSUD_171920 [Trifolium subterraneum]
MSSSETSMETTIDKDLHVTFTHMMYHLLPNPYESQEINHLTLAYFVISSIDILNSLHLVEKEAVVNWVLSFQVRPGTTDDPNNGMQMKFHLASTYCALSILKIVGYDLSNLDSESMSTSMKNLQQPDGSFMPILTGGETDLRFVYCAAAICFMLDNWSGMDKEKVKDYILNCQSYDGGFGLVPGAESHGGATYCAIASLRLMGFIEDNVLSSCNLSSLIDLPLLLDWILQRQGTDGGFQGRPNKSSDTCYAFWIGAVLRILGGCNFVDNKALHGFLLSCQYKVLHKFPGEFPDLYHSYYGFAAFSLLEESGLKSLCSELGITNTAANGV